MAAERVPGGGIMRRSVGSIRHPKRLALLGLVVFAIALLPASALATSLPQGQLAIPSSTSGTLTAAGTTYYGPYGPSAGYYSSYEFNMPAGQTIEGTCTFGSPMGYSSAMLYAQSAYNGQMTTQRVDDLTRHFTMMAPSTGWYHLVLAGSAGSTFTIDIATSTPVPYSLVGLAVPKSAKHSKSFKVSVVVTPAYNAFSWPPVRFVIDRKVGSTFRGFSSVSGRNPYPYYYAMYMQPTSGPTKVVGSMRLPRGTYRIRASFRDAAHPTAIYGLPKTVVVK
jgi:hypothetical protein